MKDKSFMINHFVAFALLMISMIVNAWHLIRYLNEGKVRYAFTFPGVVTYVTAPITVITFLIALYLLFKKRENLYSRTVIYAWLIHFSLIVALYFYFSKESNRLTVRIENLTGRDLTGLKIAARNDQYFSWTNIKNDDAVFYTCNCRHVTFVDSIGVRLVLTSTKNQPAEIDVLSPNSPLYGDVLTVKIISDSVIFISTDMLPGFWSRYRKSILYTDKQVTEEIIKYRNQSN